MAIPRQSYSLLSLIRLAYPDARSFYAGLRREGRYCVGGALYMFVHGINLEDATRMQRFPPADQIALTLMRVNPQLRFSEARAYAQCIVRANDVSFANGPARAWDILGEALEKHSKERVTADADAELAAAPLL